MARPDDPASTNNAVDGTVGANLVQSGDIGGVHSGTGHVFTGTVIYQELPAARDALVVRFTERLEEAEQVVRELVAREQDLRDRLTAESARSDELERQLQQVVQQLTDDRGDGLGERLHELQRAHDQDVRRVAELKGELVSVITRRRAAQHAVELIRSDREQVNSFFGSIEDLLELNFVRAEAERREKERLAAECTGLRAQIRTLQQTLAMYQSVD